MAQTTKMCPTCATTLNKTDVLCPSCHTDVSKLSDDQVIQGELADVKSKREVLIARPSKLSQKPKKVLLKWFMMLLLVGAATLLLVYAVARNRIEAALHALQSGPPVYGDE